MRVLLDCRMARWSGVGRYSVGLARALSARDDLSVELVVAVEDPPFGLAVTTYPAAQNPLMPSGSLELGRIARRVAPDVMHCLHFPVPRPVRHPLVVTIHDLAPLLAPGVMPSAAKRLVYRAQVGRAIRSADHILTDASFTIGEVERVFRVSRDRMSAVLLSADDFSAGEIGDRDEGSYILSMGSTRSHKDLPTLLSAFATLASRHPALRLLLAGSDVPGYVDRYLAAAPADVRARVAFTGPVSDAELRALYAHAAVFAFPSRYEGFGLPPLEAMALGTPVVTTTAASLPEVVGDAALLVSPGDASALAAALESVLSDERVRTRLIEAGRARSAAMTWERTAEETVAVYRRVLEEARA